MTGRMALCRWMMGYDLAVKHLSLNEAHAINIKWCFGIHIQTVSTINCLWVVDVWVMNNRFIGLK